VIERVAILPVGAEHLPALAEVAAQIWRAYYPSITSPAQVEYMLARMYSLETLRAEIASQGIRFYRLLVDGQLSGFASLGPVEVGTPRCGVRTAQRAVATFKLHKLYLALELHGHGLGSRLLQYCEAEARQLGAHRLVLAVNKRNSKAIAAYERNGFAVAESVVVDIGGGFVMDDFIMAKNLSGA